MPRKKAVAPSRVRTAQQAARDKMLIDAGYSKTDVWRALQRSKLPLTKQLSVASVRAALDNRYRNNDVVTAFCVLTGADPDVAFPSDEPLYKTGTPAKRSTKRGRPRNSEQHADRATQHERYIDAGPNAWDDQ